MLFSSIRLMNFVHLSLVSTFKESVLSCDRHNSVHILYLPSLSKISYLKPHTQGFDFLKKKISDGKCTSVSTLLKHLSDTITTRSHYLHILKYPEKSWYFFKKNLMVLLNHPYIILQKINLIILTLKLT